ncbi:Wntless-like transmembrane domain-containing protein [Entamoeba marina]
MHNNTSTNSHEPKLLLTKMSILGLLILVGVFVAINMFCIAITYTIPTPWTSQQYSTWKCPDESKTFSTYCTGVDLLRNPKQHLTLQFGPYTVMNQETRISVIPQKLGGKENIKLNGKLTIDYVLRGVTADMKSYTIKESSKTVSVECKAGSSSCNLIPLISEIYLSYPLYALDISLPTTTIDFGDLIIENSYINMSYSVFEMFWRLVFIIFSSTCGLIYMVSLRTIPIGKWCHEQKWTFVLLIFLVLMNNPFFFYEFLIDNVTFLMINVAINAFFICYLMFYVLSMFEALRKPISVRTSFKFIAPRASLLLLLFLAFITQLLYDHTSPTYTADLHGMNDWINITLTTMVAALCVIYLFWLIFSVIRTYSEIKKLGSEVAVRFKFYSIFTLCVIVLYVGLLAMAGFMGYHNNAVVSLETIAYVNLYVMVLSILYLPAELDNNVMQVENTQIIKLDVEEAKEEMIVFDDEFNDEVIID